jgi:hypothetical protein
MLKFYGDPQMPSASHEAPENSSSVISAALGQPDSRPLAVRRQPGADILAARSQPEADTLASKQDAALEWTVHLIRKRPAAAARIVVCFLATLFFGAVVFNSAALALLPATALLLSVSEYWLPVRYTLDSSGAKSRWGLVSLEISWTDVRHAYLTDEGIKLSPLAVPGSRMEGLRGVFLRFDDDNKDLVIETVRALRDRSA